MHHRWCDASSVSLLSEPVKPLGGLVEKPPIDLNSLARHLESKIQEKKLSVRAASALIGCSPATLSRLLLGSKSSNVPDAINIMRAISWLGKRVSDFEHAKTKPTPTLADVEAHLRALPRISKTDAEGLVAMVKAAYNAAAKQRSKKSQSR